MRESPSLVRQQLTQTLILWPDLCDWPAPGCTSAAGYQTSWRTLESVRVISTLASTTAPTASTGTNTTPSASREK